MKGDAAGAVGEIVEAVAVFLTLVYLARQINQNTKAVRATALDSSVSSVIEVRGKIFEDPSLVSIYLKGLENPAQLNEIDEARFKLLMHNITWALRLEAANALCDFDLAGETCSFYATF